MKVHETGFETSLSSVISYDEDMEVKKGPWSPEEDSLLLNYIKIYGEGKWDSLARQAGLKRTGKSCRLRWLNYLRPDLRRGNFTLQEQLLILELHFRWGNRWSKIAQYLPGRTDNEIKNYWRTRVQKQAKLLNCDVNSKRFNDILRHVWIPRLIEQIQASSESSNMNSGPTIGHGLDSLESSSMPVISSGSSSGSMETQASNPYDPSEYDNQVLVTRTSDIQQESGFYTGWGDQDGVDIRDCEQSYGGLGGEYSLEYMWNEENIWSFQQWLFDGLL